MYNTKTNYSLILPQGCKPCGARRKFVSGDHYKHGYQGQFTEKDEEVNWDAFELRNWDGRLARWTTTDPYGQYWSPYLGMGNNPINAVDPDGGFDGWVTDADGNTFWDPNTNSLAEFNQNYAGLEGFSYASRLSDFRIFDLPDGSGAFKMIDWTEVRDISHLENFKDFYAWGLEVEFIPSSANINGKGWFQTVHSNSTKIDYSNSFQVNLYDENVTPFIDIVQKSPILYDQLGRVTLETRNLSMFWKAESSYITNRGVNTITWGAYVSPSGEARFFRPTITNNRTNFHNSAINDF